MQCELQCGEACCLSTYGGLNDQKTPTETKTDSQRVPPIDSVKCVMGYTQRFTTVEHQVALALHGAPASLSLCRFSPHMFYQLADALLPQLISLGVSEELRVLFTHSFIQSFMGLSIAFKGSGHLDGHVLKGYVLKSF